MIIEIVLVVLFVLVLLFGPYVWKLYDHYSEKFNGR